MHRCVSSGDATLALSFDLLQMFVLPSVHEGADMNCRGDYLAVLITAGDVI